MSSPPDADSILTRNDVADGNFADIFRRTLRGAVYAAGLFLVSIFTGITDILQNFLDSLASGVSTVFTSFFGGNASLIEAGAEATTESFLLPEPFGWVEGLAWVIVGVYLIRWAMSAFSTDIFFLPGFDLIPSIGNEADGQDGEDE